MFRILVFGVIRTIRPFEEGGRFIVVFLSVLCLLVAKMVFIGEVVSRYTQAYLSLSAATTMIGLLFVPQLILAIFTSVGFSVSSMKLIAYHPETLLLSSGKHLKSANFKNA